MRGERGADRQFHHAAGLWPARRYRGLGAQRGCRHRLDMLAKFSPLRRQRQAFVGSREQFCAELALQQRDVAADGRMAGAQLARRRGKTSRLRDGDKGLAEVPIHRRFR